MEELKNTIRQRADEVKGYQCKNLIAVLENPMDMKKINRTAMVNRFLETYRSIN
tara:strand:- start:4007 stop:4168 length:162 start_codon:yes stop_codon:yes gene_type:complete